MLHVFAELVAHRDSETRDGLCWIELDQDALIKAMPFWALIDIKRVQKSLLDLGLILLDPASAKPDSCWYAINQTQARESHKTHSAGPTVSRVGLSANPNASNNNATHTSAADNTIDRFANAGQGASYIPANWQPSNDCIKQCRQKNIPEDFIHEQVPGFVLYWRERRQSQFSWGNVFSKHVLREWRQEQTRRGANQLDSAMSAQWWPSEDAIEILQNAGISTAFIEDCVPEFVLYWRERGIVDAAWNSKFIDHIRRQWTKYNAALEHDGMPRPIAADWQPSAACFDVLRLAEIDEDYAREKVKEFVLYWRDTGQPNASWNTQFLKYIKFNWAKRLEELQVVGTGNAKNKSITGRGGQGVGQPGSGQRGAGQRGSEQREAEKSIEASFQRFTDRSWAE